MNIHKRDILNLLRIISPKWIKTIYWKLVHSYNGLKVTFRDIQHRIRIYKPVSVILGPEYLTNLNIIDLIITYDCNLKCFGCNVLCDKAPSREYMSIDQIIKFIKESRGANKKWERIHILGGEPLTHPDILKIIDLLIEYKNSFSPKTIIRLLTNGYGPQATALLPKIPPSIEVINSHKKSQYNADFTCFTNAPIDFDKYKSAVFSNACWRTTACGLSLNKYGYYPCSVCGGIDKVFGFDLGRKILPDKVDAKILKTLDLLCRYCGGFLYSRYKIPPGCASATWAKQLQTYKTNKPLLTPY